jgi:dihydrofolate synthase / folylpolyglutamate synthase
MTYQDTLEYLYSALPMFQRIGAAAFKKDLAPTLRLCEQLGHPQEKFKSIHVAGTNGKGSTSHTLAAILQESGYKVGLYTSPHLKSFRERVKINGECIPESAVVDFVEKHRSFLDELKPSFFEMTVGLAFDHFAREQVDIAVVEVGMGGRFDSTNVLHPALSIITNIGMDHTQFLGDTLAAIAFEKAGIIKEGVPVIVGEALPETREVFEKVATERQSPISFAQYMVKASMVGDPVVREGKCLQPLDLLYGQKLLQVELDLLGKYQALNLPAIYLAWIKLKEMGWNLETADLQRAMKDVTGISGLKGRWQVLGQSPLVICDTGHNKEAVKLLMEQLLQMPFDQLYIVWGMVQDKDVQGVLRLLPKEANYLFCQADLPRAMPAQDLQMLADCVGLKGEIVPGVKDALALARKKACKDDLIFIGGSTFVVAEIEEL